MDREPIETLPEPAAWWCSHCGYLLPPSDRIDRDATDVDPMRRDPIAPAFTGACPHCRGTAWVDLGVVPLAMRLRDDDAKLRQRGRGRLAWGIASLVTMVAGLMTVAVLDFVVGYVVMLIGLISMAASGAGERTRALALSAPKVNAPGPVRRWHRPAPSWPRGARLRRGTAYASESSTTPLTERPAIGWVLAICDSDEDPRGEKSTDAGWLLVEQHCERLAIDGKPIKREPVLDLPLRPAWMVSPRGRAWLRSRGFDPNDDIRCFEGILVEGEEVELFENRTGRASICAKVDRRR